MSDAGDGGDPPRRALLVAAVAMLSVAGLVGLAIAGAVLTVVNVTGLDHSAGGSAASRPSLYMPKYHPTRSAADHPDLPRPRPSRVVDSGKVSKAQPKTDRITL